MIILKSTGLGIFLDQATAVPLPIVASFVEISDSTYTPTPIVAQTEGTAFKIIVPPAGVDYARQIKMLTVLNLNAVPVMVNLMHGSTQLLRLRLEAGYTLVYTDGRGFNVMDNTGANVAVTSNAVSVGPHNLLDGTVHPDTNLGLVSHGSMIYGDGTPKWTELLIGADNTVLRSDGLDPIWGKIDLQNDVSSTLTVSSGGTGASSLTDTGVVIAHGTSALTATRTPNVDGVSFPAVQVVSADPHTLDDYEEGSFVPTLTFRTDVGATVAGSGAVSAYLFQQANYIKIGRLVHVDIYIQLSNKGTLVGSLQLDGLPFIHQGPTSNFTAFPVARWSNLAPGGVACVLAYMPSLINKVFLDYVPIPNPVVTQNPIQLIDTIINNATQLIVSGVYYADN